MINWSTDENNAALKILKQTHVNFETRWLSASESIHQAFHSLFPWFDWHKTGGGRCSYRTNKAFRDSQKIKLWKKLKRSIENSLPTYLNSSVMTKRGFAMHSRATNPTTVWLIVVWQGSAGNWFDWDMLSEDKTQSSFAADLIHFTQASFQESSATYDWRVRFTAETWAALYARFSERAICRAVIGTCKWFSNSINMVASLEKMSDFTKANQWDTSRNTRMKTDCAAEELYFIWYW